MKAELFIVATAAIREAEDGKDFTNRKDMTYTLHHAIDNFYSNEFNNSLGCHRWCDNMDIRLL